ncbi:MAG: tRNA-specific adenosine deaminase subunit tad3 [Watsoniomyces obsoletus]|nr:MAG: tRNA-specific adenosine deaminase subunit tad3 [Watsoniomyces obsoletus]
MAASTDGSTLANQAHGSSNHHHHHNGRRLRQFLRPDGRRVHIAQSPEEEIKLRKHLESTDEPFDVYIHGSPEHVEALREIHGHHERKHEELRHQHGEVFEDFEKVRLELDALSSELRMITEHGVALDANFSRYGYSAHLRTRASPESSANSISDVNSEKHDWEAERQNGYTVRFYKRPVVRQYFHKGLLWRAPEEEEVASFELFVDLLFVGVLEVNGEFAAEHATAESLLRFSIAFILSWKIWTDFTLFISWFETDDIIQRLSVLFSLACLFGYTTNVIESGHHTYQQMIAFFLAVRMFGGVYYIWLTWLIPMIRATLIGHTILVFTACAIWIGSIHVHEPQRQALIWIAIAIDLWGFMILLFLLRGSKHVSKSFGERMQKLFEFYPAVNIEHKSERTKAFVTLVFGYSVLALLYQNKAEMGINAFYGKAILGLIQVFTFNWIYFEVDGINLYMHAIRRRIWSAIIWNNVHLPFVMAFLIGGGGLAKLVLAHDCPNTDTRTLTATYKARSVGEIEEGLRWFYCAGFGLAFMLMGVIAGCHVHKDIPTARLKKWHRLTVRTIISIIIICLPKAHSLNSLELISAMTGLLVFDLIFEVYGLTKVGEPLFGRKRKKCTYWADCPMKKKDLEEAAKTGEVVNIEVLANKQDGEKGHFENS